MDADKDTGHRTRQFLTIQDTDTRGTRQYIYINFHIYYVYGYCVHKQPKLIEAKSDCT